MSQRSKRWMAASVVMAPFVVAPFLIAPFVGAAGCSGAVSAASTIQDAGPAKSPGPVGEPTGTTCDPSTNGECLPPSAPDFGGCPGPLALAVDGVGCTPASAEQGTVGSDGRMWTLRVTGACGPLPFVDVHVRGQVDRSYPQSCADSASVDTTVADAGSPDTGPEGASAGTYGARGSSGSCVVAGGPTVDDLDTVVSLTATVVNDDAGVSHAVSIGRAGTLPPPTPTTPLSVDGVACTSDPPMFSPPTATDPRWTLGVSGTCGAYRQTDFYVSDRVDMPYPHPCPDAQAPTELMLNLNQTCREDVTRNVGSCVVVTGPSPSTGSSLVPVTVELTGPSGRKHTVVFRP